MIKIGIICGCLPEQYGIEPVDLYHQVLSRKIECELERQIEISSAWYTTLAASYSNSVKMIEASTPDLVFYHVRPDPYLRVSKLLLKYTDVTSQAFSKINLNADDSMIVDEDNNVERSVLRRKLKTVHILFRNLNYISGLIFGSNRAAIKKEEEVIQNMIRYTDGKKIPLLIMGPASRPRSFIENRLLFKLEKKLHSKFKDKKYISCFGILDKNGEALFMNDGVHVNKNGHFRFSELIFPALKKILIKQSAY